MRAGIFDFTASPFDTEMRTFEGSPEALLESDDLLPTMLDFNVIWFLQEEASVKETWNARMNKNGDAVSSTGSFHGDTPQTVVIMLTGVVVVVVLRKIVVVCRRKRHIDVLFIHLYYHIIKNTI